MTSTIKVNNIQNQCGQNIINESSNTITLGASGDNIALASGATQSGFGRTGTVDWITTPKTTGTFTAVSGEGYFLNTSDGVITANLPAGVAGAIVSLADYAETWNSNNVTVTPNGTDKIGSLNLNAILNVIGQSVTFVFVDSTQGWINTMDSTSNVRGAPPFIRATGGTITTVDTNFKVHTFTGPGTFAVTNIGTPTVGKQISYMVIAGGGGGGGQLASTTSSAGGGAGGFREAKQACAGYTASPLAVAGGQTVAVQPYPVTIGGGGGGGAAGCNPGVQGSSSIFAGSSTITSAGGGFGSGIAAAPSSGGSGGSGGGAKQDNNPGIGAGNTPPVSPAQGFPGGTSDQCGPTYWAGGGGGATVVGGNPSSPGSTTGAGGTGATSSINGTPTQRAGGGSAGGSNYPGKVRPQGSTTGGGGAGGTTGDGTAGTANTGGGGGGGAGGANPYPAAGGAGGSGIVIIRYKFQ